jgi:hypothetical protein
MCLHRTRPTADMDFPTSVVDPLTSAAVRQQLLAVRRLAAALLLLLLARLL